MTQLFGSPARAAANEDFARRYPGSMPEHEVLRIAVARQIVWVAPIVNAVMARDTWAQAPGIEGVIDMALVFVRKKALSMSQTASIGLTGDDLMRTFLPVASKLVAGLITKASTPDQFSMWVQRMEHREAQGAGPRIAGLGVIVKSFADHFPAPRENMDDLAAGAKSAICTLVAEMLSPDVIVEEKHVDALSATAGMLAREVVDFATEATTRVLGPAADNRRPSLPSLIAMCGSLMLSLAKPLFAKYGEGNPPPPEELAKVINSFVQRAQIAVSIVTERVDQMMHHDERVSFDKPVTIADRKPMPATASAQEAPAPRRQSGLQESARMEAPAPVHQQPTAQKAEQRPMKPTKIFI